MPTSDLDGLLAPFPYVLPTTHRKELIKSSSLKNSEPVEVTFRCFQATVGLLPTSTFDALLASFLYILPSYCTGNDFKSHFWNKVPTLLKPHPDAFKRQWGLTYQTRLRAALGLCCLAAQQGHQRSRNLQEPLQLSPQSTFASHAIPNSSSRYQPERQLPT